MLRTQTRGHGPIAVPGKRQSVSAASAVNAKGAFWFATYKGGMSADLFVAMLKQIMRRRRKPLFLVIDSLPAHKAKLVSLDQDVALGDEVERDLLPLCLGDVERHRAFVAVHADEVRSLLGARHERRREASRVVARARFFHLNHIGAEASVRSLSFAAMALWLVAPARMNLARHGINLL
jgi:hypothetical protein